MIFHELWPNIESKVVRGKMASLEFKAVLDKLSQYLMETPLLRSGIVCRVHMANGLSLRLL